MSKEFTKEAIYKVNMIGILTDVIDQYLTELEPGLRQGMKQMRNNADNHVKRFIRECDRVLNKDNQENFGITADEVRKIIDEIYLEE